MRDHLLPNLINKKPVSIWSAGCCNGEEACSLAVICEQLILKDDGEPDRNTVKILATDRNPAVLKRAREGRYLAGALKEMKNEEINHFFREINGNGNNYLIEKRLKRTIEFEQRDIGHSIPERIFNLVLCRNLAFTYFTEERQARFLDRLKPHLAAGGYLVTGSNEFLPKTDWLKAESKTHCVFKAGSK